MGIRVNEYNNIFSIEGKNTQYVFGIDKNDLMQHIYWGKRVENIEGFSLQDISEISSNDPVYELTREEYTPFGGLRYKEPCIKAVFSDGTRDIVYRFAGYQIEGNLLTIKVKDEYYPISIYLRYRIYEDIDILERWAEIENNGNENITLENIKSAEFNLPVENVYNFSNVSGHWGSEGRRVKETLSPGKKVFSSHKGSTGHNASPYFIADVNANEDWGNVYFGVLAYSGNFNITAEVTPYGTTRIIAGIDEFDFIWNLKDGERFITPSVYSGYTDKGYSDMTFRLGLLSKHYLMPKENCNKIMPVLYNSWEATGFNVKCEEQIELSEKAAKIGAELFVVDDGWFGGRNSDSAGLGDWYVNRDKFPDGLKPLIKKVNDLGMDFGIWIEPEMINPDSDLYREHPDWVYNFENRKRNTSRNQLVLNLTKKEVVEYIKNCIDMLLENNNIKYIKWDMNRPLSEPGALNLVKEDQKSIWVRHTNAVYEIVSYLRSKHRNVSFEACASGGGRVDYGMLSYFDQYWTSDNTDAYDRLFIQEAYSYIYPIKYMRAWVTDCPNFLTKRTIPLDFRFDCAMMGSLGIGGDLNKWTKEEFEISEKKIKEYKDIRHIIQNGRIFRLKSMLDSEIMAVQYVLDKKESVLFIFRREGRFLGKHRYTVKLRGLNEKSNYRVNDRGNTFVRSGEFLMNVGLSVEADGNFYSNLVKIICEEN